MLHTVKWGPSEPRCFLIHGFGEGHFVWNGVISHLSRHASAVGIDLRGHGDSDWDPTATYSLSDHVSDSYAALRFFCKDPAIVIGHSLGAVIGMHLAARYPESVLASILVDGGPSFDPDSIKYLRREFAHQQWWYRTQEHYISRLQEKFPLVGPDLLKSLAHFGLRSEPSGGYRLKCDKALAQSADHTNEDDSWSLFRSIMSPILVVRGRGSAVLPAAAAARMCTENAFCSVETVSSAGHSVMLDNPEGFLRAIDAYLVAWLTRAGRCW